jgi:hypothetical protein
VAKQGLEVQVKEGVGVEQPRRSRDSDPQQRLDCCPAERVQGLLPEPPATAPVLEADPSTAPFRGAAGRRRPAARP